MEVSSDCLTLSDKGHNSVNQNFWLSFRPNQNNSLQKSRWASSIKSTRNNNSQKKNQAEILPLSVLLFVSVTSSTDRKKKRNKIEKYHYFVFKNLF